MSADAPAHPCRGRPFRTVARMIAAGAGARFVLMLPGCCAAWSYPTLVVALLGALAWGAVVFRVTLVFLAASVDGTRPGSREPASPCSGS
ncbi:hypothetical protein ACQ86G_08700 [Roseateles chitinivorans]|uniref:hypothetical protein n=1 Tax=Roseateles chitinivorans TaxID=2917965 RepID=UPI003D66461A